MGDMRDEPGMDASEWRTRKMRYMRESFLLVCVLWWDWVNRQKRYERVRENKSIKIPAAIKSGGEDQLNYNHIVLGQQNLTG
jgi:hypothetical protein